MGREKTQIDSFPAVVWEVASDIRSGRTRANEGVRPTITLVIDVNVAISALIADSKIRKPIITLEPNY